MFISLALHSIRRVQAIRSALVGVFAMLMLSLATPVAAADWLCNLSEDVEHLVCLADIDLFDEVGATAATEAIAAPVVLRGNRYPLDKRTMFIVKLWAPPSEMERVEQLAQSVICFRSPACTVTMSPMAWTIAGIPRGRMPIRR